MKIAAISGLFIMAVMFSAGTAAAKWIKLEEVSTKKSAWYFDDRPVKGDRGCLVVRLKLAPDTIKRMPFGRVLYFISAHRICCQNYRMTILGITAYSPQGKPIHRVVPTPRAMQPRKGSFWYKIGKRVCTYGVKQ